MCNPASFAITKTGRVLWSKKTDSHSEIIAEHKLREDRRGSSGEPSDTLFVKVEINPPKMENRQFNFAAPLSKWQYVLDEDRAPEWYDAKKVERVARLALKEWAKSKIHLRGHRVIEDGQTVFICGGTAEVKGGKVVMMYGGTISEVSGGTISEVIGGTISEVSGGTISAVWGGTISAVRGGTISAVRGGTISAVWGGIAAKHSINANVVMPPDSAGIVVDYTTTPPSIYGNHKDGK